MYTKTFNQINRNDVLEAGGKGAFLGELTQKGILVPPGFVILTLAFERFLNVNNLNTIIKDSFTSLNQGEGSIETISNLFLSFFDKAEIPEDVGKEIKSQYSLLGAELVAVRSSATAEDNADRSWAGQLESFLNVSADNLLLSVKQCWASLYSQRAISYYLNDKGKAEAVQVAVVIQTMVNPEISGIAFSVNPVNESYDEMIIEAAFGLGEAIVQGEITPDHYCINKTSFDMIDIVLSSQERGIYKLEDGTTGWKNIEKEKGEQQKLNESEITELAKMVITIENIADFPCDIEWTYYNGRFNFVQCRPITTLN
jgi:phosphoenolpyruvate synthase/pyruvate phosphate dikinase